MTEKKTKEEWRISLEKLDAEIKKAWKNLEMLKEKAEEMKKKNERRT
jgi:hypothetical protein